MQRLLLILTLICSMSASAQYAQLRGRITDAASDETIQGCLITIASTKRSTVSNAIGQYSLPIDSMQYTVLSISIQHIGYETLRLSRSRNSGLMDFSTPGLVRLDISLKSAAYELDPIPIDAERLPEVVYASERHSIADYEFLDDQVLILVYEKRLSKSSKIYLLDSDMQAIDSLSIPSEFKPTGLTRDYADWVYLESLGGLHQIWISQGGLLLRNIDLTTYRDQVEPIIDSLGPNVFFSTWVESFPAFDYYAYNLLDSQYIHIRQVADAHMLELCRAEYKYLVSRDKLKMYKLELETGIEKEVLTCIGSFQDGIYYRPIYAPLFVFDQRLLLFDHPGNQLLTFDAGGTILDSVPIHYHDPKRVMNNPFVEQMLMDDLTGEVYAVFQYPGGRCQLMAIDIDSGEVHGTQKLTYDYPTQIQLRAGEVYYSYRPFESSQKKYLYKETLVQTP
jgi:hypothetical protein